MAFEQGGIFNVPITCVTRDLGFYGLGRWFLRSRASVFTVSGVGFYGLGRRFLRSQVSVFTVLGLGFFGLIQCTTKKGYWGPILTRIPTGTETFAN